MSADKNNTKQVANAPVQGNDTEKTVVKENSTIDKAAAKESSAIGKAAAKENSATDKVAENETVVKAAETIAAPDEKVLEKIVYQKSSGMLERDAEPNEKFGLGDEMPVYYF